LKNAAFWDIHIKTDVSKKGVASIFRVGMSSFADFSTLKMEAALSFETSFLQDTLRHIPEYGIPHSELFIVCNKLTILKHLGERVPVWSSCGFQN
jgi:hypothetical protein